MFILLSYVNFSGYSMERRVISETNSTVRQTETSYRANLIFSLIIPFCESAVSSIVRIDDA